MNRYSVEVPASEEKSDAIVDAGSPEEAADIYVRAVLADEFPADLEEMWEAGSLTVSLFPETGTAPGLVSWDEIEQTSVSLGDIPSWDKAEADFDPDDI